jgi:uncharacterized protein (TIRG00374 family)
LALSFRSVDAAEVLARLGQLGPAALYLFLPLIAGLALESWGWQRSLISAGLNVRLLPLWAVRFVTEAAGLFLPGGALTGETLKPWLLSRWAGMTIPAGVAASVYRKYLRLVAHGLYVGSAALLGAWAWQHGPSSTGWRQLAPWLVSALGVFAVVLFALAASMATSFRRGAFGLVVLRALGRLPFAGLADRLAARQRAFGEMDDDTRRLFRQSALGQVPAILLCLVAWFSEALESWVLLWLLGCPVDFAALLAIDVGLSLVRQLLVFLPAGLGVQDVGYLAALGALGVTDPATTGAAFVVLKRARELVTCGVAAAVWALGNGLVRTGSERPALLARLS